jgi:hypothetical protein
MKQYMIILNEDMKNRLALLLGGSIEFIEVVGLSSVQGGKCFDILMTPSNNTPVSNVQDPETPAEEMNNGNE